MILMAAVFDVVWDYGGSANTPGTTEESLTNLRFNVEDTNDQDTNSPVVIPGAGTEYSYIKHVYLDCTTAPDTQVDTMTVYTDGTLGWGTGFTVKVGDGTQTKTSASSAGYYPAATLGQAVMTGHDTVSASTDLFSYTSGSARSVSISETSNLINAINEKTDYLVLQLEVASTATATGTKSAETITFSWSEI